MKNAEKSRERGAGSRGLEKVWGRGLRRRNFIPQSGTNTKLRAVVAGRIGNAKVQWAATGCGGFDQDKVKSTKINQLAVKKNPKTNLQSHISLNAGAFDVNSGRSGNSASPAFVRLWRIMKFLAK
jgi:hypothetical protein